MEKYLDNIISRCKSFIKNVFFGQLVLTLILLTISVVICYLAPNSLLATFLSLLGVLLSSLVAVVYIIFRLQACMNECDLIKLKLSINGDLNSVEDIINRTKCTQNIDVATLKKAITPINISKSTGL